MPKIPIMEGTRKEAVGTQAPTLELNRAGIVASALSNLGGQAAEIGMEIYKRRQKEELIDWTSKSYYDYTRDVQQQELALKDKYSGTDFKGYAQEFDKIVSDTKQKYLNGADSDAKRNFFNDKASLFASEKLIHADRFEHESNANYYDNAKVQQIQNIGGDGDYIQANRALKDLSLQIQVSERSTPQKRAMFEEEMSKSSVNIIKSMIMLKNTKGAIAVLDGKDEVNSDEILKRLTPFEKTQLRAMAVNSEMTMKNELWQSVARNLSNAEISVATGERAPGDPLITKAEADIELLPEEQRAEARKRITFVKALAQLSNGLDSVPPHERNIESFVDLKADDIKTNDPLAKSAFKGQLKEKAAAIFSNLNAQFQKDPVSYYVKRDPLLADLSVAAVQGDPQVYEQYKIKLDAYYDRWRVAPQNRKYASPAMKQVFGEGITKVFSDRPEGAENLALELFNKFESMSGQKSYSLLKEMDIPEKYAVIGEIKNQSLRRNAIRNIMFPIKDDQYKIEYPDAKANEELQDLRDSNDLYKAYASIADDQSSFENAKTILDTVHQEYRRLKMKGIKSDTEARNMAWKMFDESFTVLNEKQSSVLIPKEIANTDNILNFMEDYLETKTDNFTKGNHKWVSAPERDGMMLLAPSNDNPSYYQFLKDEKGQPVIFKYDDINKVNYPARKSWLDEQAKKQRMMREKDRTKAPGMTGYDTLK
jgi:hypothetical protein